MNHNFKLFGLLFLCCLFFGVYPSFSQKTINLSFNRNGLMIEEIDLKSRKLKLGENYRLTVDGVNSAHIKAVIKPKSFNLQSNISEPLKVGFPGISTSGDVGKVYDELNTKIDAVRKSYSFLQLVDSLSKEVFKATRFSPSDSIVRKIIGDKLPINLEGETLKKTEENIIFLSYFAEKYSLWFNKKLENGTLNEEDFKLGLELQIIRKVIDKEDFLNKAAFLEKSMKAKPSITTEGFKAENDGVDLQISIIDTFKKDTLYKGEIEFVNYKMWNFDFSTGFIFSQLVDIPYSLSPAMEGKKEVLEEDYSNWDIAIGGLAHLTYKFSGFMSFGPQVGIGISILDTKPKYAVGFGFLLGRKSKVSLNGGLVFGKERRLSNQVEIINNRFFVSESLTSVPTFERFGTAPYFSLSYNLTKKRF
ncbi:hypothetical protein [Shivajiella indica]|uniref:Uncharacterized protein n=1 Tax=Shivajiella indica TaxID=872115 RepID=A0ABW5B274_9BACT